ncbi:hypothetical protein FRC14_004482 [Serendipita sp. 396]|nr:hypothetical protein FRC14_004482 [Serendipita sp. 396]
MSHYSGTVYQPGIVPVGPVGGLPMGGMVGGVPMTPAYGTPYGTPHIDTYPPSLARMPSNYAPSLYEGRRATYDDVYDYDRGYGRDYLDRDYERERRYYDDDDLLYRSSSRSSRRSRRGDYYDSGRDYYYDRDRDYYDDRYRSSSRGYYVSLNLNGM